MSQISISDIRNHLLNGHAPNMYPTEQFLKEHYEIIKPFAAEVKLYKGSCYKELNTFYKTGEIINQYGCQESDLNKVAEKHGNLKMTIEEKIKLVADRLQLLYDLVKPLDHDIIIYRGVKKGTIGQNFFTGKCIKSRLYDLEEHRFCDSTDIEQTKFWIDRQPHEDPRDYVAETLGFVSFTTNIKIVDTFAGLGENQFDTIIALRLPAGSKFVMPIDSNLNDAEKELMLFPLHNTYFIHDSVKYLFTGTSTKTPVYIGSICNDLNVHRPKGFPKLRSLRVKILNPSLWKQSKAPIFRIDTKKCENADCHNFLHLCDPETGKCIGDNQKSQEYLKNWWREYNVKGKCTKLRVSKCVEKDLVCNPSDGKCILDNKGNYDYSAQIVKEWIEPNELAV